MSNRHFLLSLPLLFLLFFIIWLTFGLNKNYVAAKTKLDSRPDAWMEEVNAAIFDKQGKMSIKLKTNKMVHYTKQDTSYIYSPFIILYSYGNNPWFVTAKYAKALEGIKELYFNGQVQLHQTKDDKHPDTLIKTNSLLVHPKENTIQTKDPIALFQPNITIHAVGLFANTKSGKISLLSDVRGVYVPH